MIYHITSKAQWDEAKQRGVFRDPSLERDGFIHCSTVGQLIAVANRLFRHRQDLVLLRIDPSRLRSRLAYEDLHRSGDRYPHIYGDLNLEAVVNIVGFQPKTNGTFERPRSVR